MAQSKRRRMQGAEHAPEPAPKRRTLAFAAILIIAGAWAYQTSFAGAFVFDDFSAIATNPNTKSLWPVTSGMSAPPDTPLAGRPLAALTFALNYAVAPPDARDVFEPRSTGAATDSSALLTRNAWGYHLVNVFVHLLAGLALFGVARRTLQTARLRPLLGSAASGLSFAIALVWMVHPIHTESITYVIQRVESLMGLFVLLALYCSIRAVDSTRPRLWTAAAIASAVLGVASKEVGAVTIVLVVAWDSVFLARDSNNGGRSATVPPRRWPLYTGLVLAALLLALVEPGARSKSVGLYLEGWSPWTYLLTESGVLIHYIRLMFWPSPLVLDSFWPMVTSLGDVVVPVVALTLLAALTLVGLRGRRPLAFLGAWFFVILAPTSSVLPIVSEVAAERRMYLPSAAIIAFVVVGAYLLCQSLQKRLTAGSLGKRIGLVFGAVLLTGIALALGTETRARNLDYSSDELIWRDTIRKQPSNARARTALGADLVIAGRYPEAESVLLSSLALDGSRAETLSNLGAAEFALGKLDSSVTHLERAIALRPEYIDAHRNLAEAYGARHQDALAAPQYRLVVGVRPNNVAVLNHYALILAVSSDDSVRNGAMAFELANRAVNLTSRRDATSLATLATALAELGRFAAAAATLQEAMELPSTDPALRAELSSLRDSYAARQKIRRPARS